MFITLEGGEGAGKTTLLQKLASALESMGFSVVMTREPGGTSLSDLIRKWVLDRDHTMAIGRKAELLLFLAGRAQHIEEVIAPSLSQGKYVLCDRFNDSTIAYQGAGRGIAKEKVEALCDVVCESIVPALTFFLDVEPEIGLLRTKKENKENAATGEVDRIESEALEFHRFVRMGFLEIARNHPERVVVLDAMQNQDAVFQQALAILKHKIEQ